LSRDGKEEVVKRGTVWALGADKVTVNTASMVPKSGSVTVTSFTLKHGCGTVTSFNNNAVLLDPY
jgi:hypothetical protein